MENKLGPILVAAVLLMGAGCAGPVMSSNGRPHVAMEAPPPPPPELTPEQERDRDEAKQVYMTCLEHAAHYANEKAMGAGDVAAVIAPMCYPQFLQFELASTAGFSDRARRAYDRKGDQRQLDLAGDAIRKERGLALSSR